MNRIKPSKTEPLFLNELGIHIPPGKRREMSKGWRVFWVLLPIIICVSVLVALSGHQVPQL